MGETFRKNQEKSLTARNNRGDVKLKLLYKTTWQFLLYNALMYINENLFTFTTSLQSIHHSFDQRKM